MSHHRSKSIKPRTLHALCGAMLACLAIQVNAERQAATFNANGTVRDQLVLPPVTKRVPASAPVPVPTPASADYLLLTGPSYPVINADALDPGPTPALNKKQQAEEQSLWSSLKRFLRQDTPPVSATLEPELPVKIIPAPTPSFTVSPVSDPIDIILVPDAPVVPVTASELLEPPPISPKSASFESKTKKTGLKSKKKKTKLEIEAEKFLPPPVDDPADAVALASFTGTPGEDLTSVFARWADQTQTKVVWAGFDEHPAAECKSTCTDLPSFILENPVDYPLDVSPFTAISRVLKHLPFNINGTAEQTGTTEVTLRYRPPLAVD